MRQLPEATTTAYSRALFQVIHIKREIHVWLVASLATYSRAGLANKTRSLVQPQRNANFLEI